MATRQRRRRVTYENENQQANGGDKNQNIASGPVMFMEQQDYKMVQQDSSNPTNLVLVKKQEFNEEEKRQAFKKKLRKYSSKNQEFYQLP